MHDFQRTAQRALAPHRPTQEKEVPSVDDSWVSIFDHFQGSAYNMSGRRYRNRTFRTRLVVFWMLSNAGLTMAIQNIAGMSLWSEGYLGILYSYSSNDQASIQMRTPLDTGNPGCEL